MLRLGRLRRGRGAAGAGRRFSAGAVLLVTSAVVVAAGMLRAVPWPLPHRTASGEMVLPAARHEAADVRGRFIASAFALLIAALALVTLCTLWLFPYPVTDRTLHAPLPVFPAPRLQPSPRQEMQRFLAAEMAELASYGWVDKAHGVVHLPIDVAMRKIARRGIPDWPTPPAPPSSPGAPP